MLLGRAAFRISLAVALWLSATALFSKGQIPEQYPKPLLHTPTDHPAAHVVLLNVDGLNAGDLALWVEKHPGSALAALSAQGVTYTDASVPWPDHAAGLLALVTGGTPISTGVVTEEIYDRATLPSGAAHAQVRVNNLFEVMAARGARTAWAGRYVWLTDMLRGPSGKGLSESCVRATDAERTSALLQWIDGKDADSKAAAVPTVMGMDLRSVGEAKRGPGGGYTDAAGTAGPNLSRALGAVDAAVGAIVSELRAKGLMDSTWVVVTASYGRAPSAARERQVPLAAIERALPAGMVAHISASGATFVWLKEPDKVRAAVRALATQARALGIDRIDAGAALALTANPATQDSRMPEMVLYPMSGVRFTPAADGSATAADAHVALLVAGAHLTARQDKTPVPTTQLAPLLLRALGLEKFDLQALHSEHTPALPGIF